MENTLKFAQNDKPNGATTDTKTHTTEQEKQLFADQTFKQDFSNDITIISESQERVIITVEDTPFTVIADENQVNLLMGKYLLESHETITNAIESAKRITWDKIFKVVLVFVKEETNNKE